MDPTRLQLHNQSQRYNETFKEYTQRWHEMASRVRPSMSDTELDNIFMGTLQGLYYENMVGSSSSNFADIVVIGEMIESGLKSGKIASGNNNQQSAARKPPSSYAKKKEG